MTPQEQKVNQLYGWAASATYLQSAQSDIAGALQMLSTLHATGAATAEQVEEVEVLLKAITGIAFNILKQTYKENFSDDAKTQDVTEPKGLLN